MAILTPNFDVHIAPCLQSLDVLVEVRDVFLTQGGFVEIKVHAFEHQFLRRRGFGRDISNRRRRRRDISRRGSGSRRG